MGPGAEGDAVASEEGKESPLRIVACRRFVGKCFCLQVLPADRLAHMKGRGTVSYVAGKIAGPATQSEESHDR